jgi:hypothetical protein
MKLPLSTIKFSILLFLSLSFFACGGGGSGKSGSGNDCASNANCPVGEFCNFIDLSCGSTGLPGSCTTIPILDCNLPTSSELVGAVCSCERLTFNNQCWAESAGQSISAAGECP